MSTSSDDGEADTDTPCITAQYGNDLMTEQLWTLVSCMYSWPGVSRVTYGRERQYDEEGNRNEPAPGRPDHPVRVRPETKGDFALINKEDRHGPDNSEGNQDTDCV